MQVDAEGFEYPVKDNERCISCGACQKVCPAYFDVKSEFNRTYTLKAVSKELLQKSSSGGAFSLISETFLAWGGLVCGAAYDNNFKVMHILSSDISHMRKSKYVQSDLKTAIPMVSDALKAGKKVLFSGTPCQCHAMKLLFSEYSSLFYTLSVVCRGVSSPKFWQKYLEYISLSNGELSSLDLRDKTHGSHGRYVSYKFDNDTKIVTKPLTDDAFMNIYTKTLSLRPSCHTCKYTCPDNDFDFTIGDAWNKNGDIDNDDGLGKSIVIVHTSRAAEIMETLESKASITESGENFELQPALCSPAAETILRKLFFKDLAQNTPMDIIVKKYGTGLKHI